MKRILTFIIVFTFLHILAFAQPELTPETIALPELTTPDIDVNISDMAFCSNAEINDTETTEIISSDEMPVIDETKQETTPVYFNYKDTKEWSKYKTLRAIGWSFLGVGLPSILVGPCLALTGGLTGDRVGLAAGGIMLLMGMAMTISSVPILICAYYNRNKAKKMNMDLGFSAIDTQLSFGKPNSIPALAFTLNF